ncbi:hypothetical protein D9619_003586 [Psilocybe cf. subviscida]|uniref:F-box domain-containing protein n=1 Tax=Psilocybe cf. subviscida TaxID=2480587 RepID=A0A8H5ETF3_9AGAR|nr:hypothetical protein D9619_003586 [Psilocybe cf. subviscida]
MSSTVALTSQPLPAEVLEFFIDALSKDRSADARRAMRTSALVCRSFRNRAHHHIFWRLEFVQPPYSTSSKTLSRLFNFRGLVEAGQKLPLLTTPLYHIRSFKLAMDGSLFEAYAILENPDLVSILELIQKYSWDIRKVSLKGSSFPIVWPDLTWDFRMALKQLCRSSPSLTTLCLENMTGVPHTMLLGTKIRHVRFHLIEFAVGALDLLPRFRYNHPVEPQLESIDIDYTFPFPEDNPLNHSGTDEMSLGQYQSIFSGVKRLKYLIYRSDDLERFLSLAQKLSSSLDTVDLELSNSDNGFLRALTWEIPLDSLPNLGRILLRHKSLVSVGTRHPLVKVASILRNMIIPASLQAIEVAFEVRSDPPWLKTGHFFPDPHNWALLDKILTDNKFERVREVVFHLRYFTVQAPPWAFNETVFVDRCRSCIQDVFPLLYASLKTVHVDIRVLPVVGGNEEPIFDS